MYSSGWHAYLLHFDLLLVGSFRWLQKATTFSSIFPRIGQEIVAQINNMHQIRLEAQHTLAQTLHEQRRRRRNVNYLREQRHKQISEREYNPLILAEMQKKLQKRRTIHLIKEFGHISRQHHVNDNHASAMRKKKKKKKEHFQ